MLLSAALALAHLPHDVVLGIAAPATLDDSAPWFAALEPTERLLLERSDDGGRTWAPFAGDMLADEVRWAHMLDDGTVFLIGADRFWVSTDRGASWVPHVPPLPVQAAAAGATAVWLATGDGVYEATSDGIVGVDTVGADLRRLYADGEHASALDARGRVWTLDPAGGWVERADDRVLTAISADGTYGGDEAGDVWWWNGSRYEGCGPIPVDDPDYPQIVHIRVEAGDVWVQTATVGPYLSVNGCATWVGRRTGHTTLYGSAGMAQNPTEASPVLDVAGDVVVQAGWIGTFLSRDRGLTWEQPAHLPPDYTRGVAFVPGNDRGVLFGPYSTGPAQTLDGGRTYAAPSHGLSMPNVQQVGFPWQATDGLHAWARVNHHTWLSRDAGSSWTDTTPCYSSSGEVQAFGTVDHLWCFAGVATSDDVALGSVLESRDGGQTWAAVPGLDAVTGGAMGVTSIRASSPSGGMGDCVITAEPAGVYCREDGGDWQVVAAGGAGPGLAVVEPAGTPGLLVWADASGVHRAVDWGGGGVLGADPTGGDPIVALAAADDGTVFLATVSSRLFRSRDAGLSWEDLALRPSAPIFVLAARPGFREKPDLLIATLDGLFRVRDAGGDAPVLERFASWQRVDSSSELWQCTGCAYEDLASDQLRVLQEADPTASLDSRIRITPGLVLATTVRGERLAVEGVSEGASSVQVVVDGEVVGVFGAELVSAQGVLWTSESFAEGRHRVELIGVEGEGVLFDALVAWGEGEPLDAEGDTGTTTTTHTGADTFATDSDPSDAEPPRRASPPDGCGCGGGSASIVLLAPLVGFTRRRRHG